ncbi:Chloride channel CLIC-like protein 1 [Camponotus japonicus]
MQFFKSSIYIILYLYALYSNVYCDETDTLDDVTPSTEELESIYSFFYKSTEKDFSSEKSTAQAKTNDQFAIQSYNCKELNGQNTQEAIFYKRLITILLSNLAIQRIDDKVIGILNIEASSSQFEYLQNFVNGQGSIREVDRILDNVIKQPDYTMYHYMADMSHYLLSEHLMNYLLIMKEHWDITIISLVVISSFMILRRQRWSRGLIIFLLIDVIFIISFFLTWWRLIQEAEIKLMAAQAQFVEMPIACQPHKMGLWDKMVASFSSTNDCEKYYESIMTNPRLQVTPAYALTYFLSTVILQPVSYCGLVISEFIDNATSKLNFVYKIPIMIILYLTVCLLIILVPLFLWISFGGSINFGIGPFLNFGIKGKTNSNEKQERIERIYEDISPKKKLKDSKKMKQILSKQQDKADPAGGDAGIDIHNLNEKRIKCKCENKNADESMEYEEKEEKDNDC